MLVRNFLYYVNDTRALICLCLTMMSHWDKLRDPWDSLGFTISFATYPLFYSSKLNACLIPLPCGLRHRHWLRAISHHCMGLNPGLGMWEFACDLESGGGFLHYLQLASHELASIWHKCDEKRNNKFQNSVAMAVVLRAFPIHILWTQYMYGRHHLGCFWSLLVTHIFLHSRSSIYRRTDLVGGHESRLDIYPGNMWSRYWSFQNR